MCVYLHALRNDGKNIMLKFYLLNYLFWKCATYIKKEKLHCIIYNDILKTYYITSKFLTCFIKPPTITLFSLQPHITISGQIWCSVCTLFQLFDHYIIIFIFTSNQFYFMTSGDPSKYHQRLTSSLRSTYRLCIIASLSDYMTVCRLLNAHTSYSLSIKDLALLWKIFKDHFFQKITKPNIWPYFYLLHIL